MKILSPAVVYTEAALTDLEEITAYIATDNIEVAQRFANRLVDLAELFVARHLVFYFLLSSFYFVCNGGSRSRYRKMRNGNSRALQNRGIKMRGWANVRNSQPT